MNKKYRKNIIYVEPNYMSHMFAFLELESEYFDYCYQGDNYFICSDEGAWYNFNKESLDGFNLDIEQITFHTLMRRYVTIYPEIIRHMKTDTISLNVLT